VDAAPWLAQGANAGGPPKVVKTHACYAEVPKGCGRYIYVLRDGRDVAVSSYHHQRRNGYRGTFHQFFAEFTRGEVRFGSWFDHVCEWIENPDGLKVLYIRFEDLLADLRGSVERIFPGFSTAARLSSCGSTKPSWTSRPGNFLR
jgi:hypothetical protein